ncbi:MAG: phosphoribosylanthranilate isomerase [Thermoleophilaceae bacterium]
MTAVKACGITNLDDAHRAVDLGAWALGLVFWPESPRRCEIEDAERIGAELRRRAEIGGVFVNATLDHVATVADRCSLSLLQLHGDEGPAYCAEAARRTGCKVIKAVRVSSTAQVRALEPYNVDFHMFDASVPGQWGGTGETFNWELVPGRSKLPVVLSGGLTPDNVADGIRATRPFAVDTASGTEASPGRKDLARLTAFFRAVEATDSATAAV